MTTPKHVPIGPITCGNDLPLTVIAGPCQLESLDHALMIAETMVRACADAGASFVFKASYDKANRTSLSGRRGLGIDEGLAILAAAVLLSGWRRETPVGRVGWIAAAGAW